MWIKSKQKRYRYDYYEEVVEVPGVFPHNNDMRTRRVWKSRLVWVECDVWVGKKKYQKKPGQKKKVLTEKEVAKNDWRDERKLKKDKAKPTWGQNGCKKFFKKHGWKRHRIHNKKCINAGNYDKMHRKDYKFFVNPWDWD